MMTNTRSVISARARYGLGFLAVMALSCAVVWLEESSINFGDGSRRKEWAYMHRDPHDSWVRPVRGGSSSCARHSTRLPRIFPTIADHTTIADHNKTTASIQKIHILGERNSGTKYIGNLLRAAFGSRYSTASNGPKHELADFTTEYERNIPIYRFKHMFRHDLLNATEEAEVEKMTQTLWLLVVRNPCDWIDAMYRLPWHLCPQGKIDWCRRQSKVDRIGQTLRMSRKDFMQVNWTDWNEVKRLPLDRNVEDYSYHKIFALRTHKLRLMMQLIKLHPHNIQVVHLNDVAKRSEVFIQELVDTFGLELYPRFNTSFPRRSQVKTSICLPEKEWAIAQKEIDWELEAFFGFSQLDCRMCLDRRESPKALVL